MINEQKDQDWEKQHGGLMKKFLAHLNSHTDKFILKGGTSLFLFYGLDRFSEDLDFDGITDRSKIKPYVTSFATANKFQIRQAKNTGYGERFLISYGEGYQLKIETSTRSPSIAPDLYSKKDDVLVYHLDHLANQKMHAFSERDKLRDLYDILFIALNHWSNLSPATQQLYLDTLKVDGYAKYDHLIKNQVADGQPKDALIELSKLEDNLLAAFEQLDITI
jgi:hypothetical protein